MPQYISSSPHVNRRRKTPMVMLWVAICLLPAIAVQVYFYGEAVLIQLLFAILLAWGFEAAIMLLRRRSIKVIKDNTALVTAMLIAVSIPPLSPWWITVIGVFFAIVIAKQLYGGLGSNLFNPAMVAYVVLLISFPVQMTSWLDPSTLKYLSLSFLDQLALIFNGLSLDGYSLAQVRADYDGVTMATPLDTYKTSLTLGLNQDDIQNAIFQTSSILRASIATNSAFLFGGLVLIALHIIQWRIPLTFLATLLICNLVHGLATEDATLPFDVLMLSGATMIGAFFIATDPTTASTTPNGRIVYAAFIGIITYIIRVWGGFPDGVAFAVLLANMLVPLIDYYTKPRVYGHKR